MSVTENIKNTIKKCVTKTETPFTAERAWIETTYGPGSYKAIEKRIKDKQDSIKDIIKGKSEFSLQLSKSYRCVIDIEDDLKGHIKEIFQPFIEGGFEVLNLSESIDAIKDDNVYLISWKNIFNK